MGERCKDRKYLGVNWNKKLLRGIQCVLNATHGVVGPKRKFFEHAFGGDHKEFLEILYIPEDLILHRQENEDNGRIDAWKNAFRKLSDSNKEKFIELIASNEFTNDKTPEFAKELYSFFISK